MIAADVRRIPKFRRVFPSPFFPRPFALATLTQSLLRMFCLGFSLSFVFHPGFSPLSFTSVGEHEVNVNLFHIGPFVMNDAGRI